MANADTIAATATAPGRGGIGVLRVSGPRVPAIAEAMLGACPRPRHATLGDFRDADDRLIDQGLALYFPAPHSYTGEDVLELQGHGGVAVQRLLLARALALGARLAEPGEFTKRAFLAGKLDLAQAEAVADLIDAASAQAARSAARSLEGEFSRRVDALVAGLVEARMYLEATLDFPEEELEGHAASRTRADVAALLGQVRDVERAASAGRLLREGLRVVMAGQPNVGKSSLLNRLAGDEVAIVTALPGTTRDPIRETLSLEGIPLHVTDTAGLRETTDAVERIGVEKAWGALAKADVVLLVLDAREGRRVADRAVLARVPAGVPVVEVHNKIDLGCEAARVPGEEGASAVFVSALTGEGMDDLKRAVLALAGRVPSTEGAFMARERHVRALARARTHLEGAGEPGLGPEMVAEELRLAQEALNTITGAFGADDLLGEIFSRFCIGK